MRFVVGCFCLMSGCLASGAEPKMLFDFNNDTRGWVALHAVDDLRATPEGLSFVCTGEDPYICGPSTEGMPVDRGMLLSIRMKSTGDAHGEVFYGRSFQSGMEVAFSITPDGEWHEYTVTIPPLEAGSRLRIDPAANTGRVTIAWIKALPFDSFMNLEFPVPRRVTVDEGVHRVRSGDLIVAHGSRHWNEFVVQVGDREMAAAHGQARIGVATPDGVDYLHLGDVPLELQVEPDGSLVTAIEVIDDDGVRWSLKRTFVPVAGQHAVSVTSTLRVDQDREVVHLPMITLFPGHGTFGERKHQAVLPGVEYLADEPSSSEADVRGERANRRIVADYRLTFPMMAMAAGGRYIGLAWDRSDHPAPVFDSPDRVYHSGAHLMGLWYPAVGPHRLESDLGVMRAFRLRANTPVTLTTTLFGGIGETVNPAVRHGIGLTGGLPPLPDLNGGLPAAVKLLAHGWLDSALNVDWTWRHAVWQDRFGPGPVADAPGYMLWLAAHTDDRSLALRLREGAQKGLERLTPPDAYEAHCSHVARPFAPLIFGELDTYTERRVTRARKGLASFDPQGLIHYRPKPDGTDYGRTHWTDHANGLSAIPLEDILETATFSGDEALTGQALDLLDRQLEVYTNTVPRGAQTWEMPLHTPDILASARILRCCALAYQLTGDARYIQAGRYWAWTGVSMVYLDPPTPGPIGVYATTAVLGATNWAAPYWIGLPVQWCGLVYRSALQDFSRIDHELGSFWAHLATGITRSGLQQTFPLDDESRQGLLPDFFHLREQRSDGPAINPGTVQAHLAEAYGATPIYSLRRVTDHGMLLHVPGDIGDVQDTDSAVAIQITGWYAKPYWIRLVRVGEKAPDVALQGGTILATQHDRALQTLNIQVEGSGTLVLSR